MRLITRNERQLKSASNLANHKTHTQKLSLEI